MDGQGKIHKSGWKVEEKKVQCDGTAEGDERSGRGERTERKRLAVDTYYLTLYNIPTQ